MFDGCERGTIGVLLVSGRDLKHIKYVSINRRALHLSHTCRRIEMRLLWSPVFGGSLLAIHRRSLEGDRSWMSANSSVSKAKTSWLSKRIILRIPPQRWADVASLCRDKGQDLQAIACLVNQVSPSSPSSPRSLNSAHRATRPS